jgi:hypothetical protein
VVGAVVKAARYATGGRRKDPAEADDHALVRFCGGFPQNPHPLRWRRPPIAFHLTSGLSHLILLQLLIQFDDDRGQG